MKKLFAMVLVLGVLVSLCACSPKGDANADADAATSESTNASNEVQDNNTVENTTGASQNTPAEETNATTEATNETTGSINQPQSSPAGCSHTWKDATCNSPKTCTKCGEFGGNPIGHTFSIAATCTQPQTCVRCGMAGNPAEGHKWSSATCQKAKVCSVCNATEGGLGDHKYLANDRCMYCNERKPVYVGLTDGQWQLDALNGQELDRFVLTFSSNGTGYMSVSFWGKQQGYGQSVNFNGATYYDQGFGKGADVTYTESGDTVTAQVSAYGGMNVGSMTLSRTAINKYTVTAVSGTIINDSITSVLPVGTVFTGVG